MPHLTKTIQKGLFETEMGPRPPERSHPPFIPHSADHEHMDERVSVATMMTPDEAVFYNRACFPRYSLLDVANLPPRTRGKHY